MLDSSVPRSSLAEFEKEYHHPPHRAIQGFVDFDSALFNSIEAKSQYNLESKMGHNNDNQKKTSTLQIFTSVCAALVLGWLVLGTQANQTSAQQSNFMGGSPRVADSDDVSTLRLIFPAGVRSNWHSHSWGQLLMVEEGRGLTQDRGGPLLEMHPGEPWWTPSGREHWHGAHPDEDVLQMTIYEGEVNWLEGVTDSVYNAARTRP